LGAEVTESLNRAGRSFAAQLHAYLDWLRPLTAESGLAWQDVVVAEPRFDDPVETRDPERSPAEFAARFTEILGAVQRCWVNLTAESIDDGRLLVVVEWFTRPYREGPPGRPVSVNWSGLPNSDVARLTGDRPS
jgi:hypothetical protein